MDRLQRAFKMLGGVTWKEGSYEYALIHDASRGFWVDRPSGDGEWDWDHFCSDHEAESLLLRALLDKAEEKWPEVRLYRSSNVRASLEYQWIIWENDMSDTALGHGPTVFDALLDALENANA